MQILDKKLSLLLQLDDKKIEIPVWKNSHKSFPLSSTTINNGLIYLISQEKDIILFSSLTYFPLNQSRKIFDLLWHY
jgi:hypothetical protein